MGTCASGRESSASYYRRAVGVEQHLVPWAVRSVVVERDRAGRERPGGERNGSACLIDRYDSWGYHALHISHAR